MSTAADISLIDAINAELEPMNPQAIVRWAVAHADGQAIVSTNFRPLEAVILHLAVSVQPDIPVLWVDHGHNISPTYAFAERLRELLGLQIRRYAPVEPTEIPIAVATPEDERTSEEDEAIHEFSEKVKLEPFRRGLAELAPKVWITGLRRVQNPNRASMNLAEMGPNGILKINPVLNWTDAEMEKYLQTHQLPDEQRYFDPAKAGEKRECGLHTRMR